MELRNLFFVVKAISSAQGHNFPFVTLFCFVERKAEFLRSITNCDNNKELIHSNLIF